MCQDSTSGLARSAKAAPEPAASEPQGWGWGVDRNRPLMTAGERRAGGSQCPDSDKEAAKLTLPRVRTGVGSQEARSLQIQFPLGTRQRVHP